MKLCSVSSVIVWCSCVSVRLGVMCSVWLYVCSVILCV